MAGPRRAPAWATTTLPSPSSSRSRRSIRKRSLGGGVGRQLAAEVEQDPPEHAGQVRLADPDALRDLLLAQPLEEPHLDDRAVALVQRLQQVGDEQAVVDAPEADRDLAGQHVVGGAVVVGRGWRDRGGGTGGTRLERVQDV